MIFANICQCCEQARRQSIKTLLLILLSFGVLSACSDSDQPVRERQVRQAPSNQRAKVIRLKPKQTHPNQRVALVIGNGAYHKAPLQNPPNDSDDMATVLKQVGFEVSILKNASLKVMETAIQQFGEKLKKGGVGLFYFAGHGVQYQGENYLFPIGAMGSVTVAEHLPYETLRVGYLLATMEGARNNLNVVILDACRNNPFARSLFIGRGMNNPDGLALLEVPSGTLIAYATRPNKRALDSTGGRNSPYVKHLKQELLKPGISILKVLTNVRVAVKKETKNRQAPGFYSELDKDFCFVGPCGQNAPSPPTPVLKPDSDRDGVGDSLDKCPDNTSEELAKGVYKEGTQIGCPLESDNDGVPDYRDDCPYDRAEELAQGIDSRGCPLDTDRDCGAARIKFPLGGAVPSPVTVKGTVDFIPKGYNLWLMFYHQKTGAYGGSLINLTGNNWMQDIKLVGGTREDNVFSLELILLEKAKTPLLKQLLLKQNGAKDEKLLQSRLICDQKVVELRDDMQSSFPTCKRDGVVSQSRIFDVTPIDDRNQVWVKVYGNQNVIPEGKYWWAGALSGNLYSPRLQITRDKLNSGKIFQETMPIPTDSSEIALLEVGQETDKQFTTAIRNQREGAFSYLTDVCIRAIKDFP